MATVKVWNDNKYPHAERFKGTMIEIPPGGHIEMEYEEAVEFKGQFTAPLNDNADQPDPRHFKMIRVEIPKVMSVKVDPLICHADGSRAADDADLAQRLEHYKHRLVEDTSAEKAGREAQQRRIDDLEGQVARLTAAWGAQEVKRGPGRPRKEA